MAAMSVGGGKTKAGKQGKGERGRWRWRWRRRWVVIAGRVQAEPAWPPKAESGGRRGRQWRRGLDAEDAGQAQRDAGVLVRAWL